jgi:hypothetical protein
MDLSREAWQNVDFLVDLARGQNDQMWTFSGGNLQNVDLFSGKMAKCGPFMTILWTF